MAKWCRHGALGCTQCEDPAAFHAAVTRDENEPPTCSQCGGPLVELGTLGNLTHYRCRNCGWTEEG